MRASTDIDLKQMLDRAQLPALPQSAIRLLELSQDPENGPAEFAVPIESDPGLTGQVLRFVNSSYFGFVQEISSIKLAIALVGIRTIKNFSLWSSVFSLMPNPKCGLFDLKGLWQDSVRRALFARKFGKMLELAEAEELFAAALLQDMAVPLLAKELPSEYQSLFEARNDSTVRLSDLEQERFGWTHAEAGALMALGWKLPESFASLIKSHVDDLDGPQLSAAESTMCLAARLPSTFDRQWAERESFAEAYAALAGKDAPAVAGVLEEVDRDFGEFAPILKLAVPAQTLVESFNENTAAAV